MRAVARIAALIAASALASTGCQSHQNKVDGQDSHQAKIDALQQEYDQLAKQFHQDCSAEYLKIPPNISPKCTDEDKKVKAAWDRLQAEQAKK